MVNRATLKLFVSVRSHVLAPIRRGLFLELLGLDLIDEWLPSDLGRLRSYLEPVA
jgi:hypothetical protein